MARLKIGNIKGPTGATGQNGVSITGIELKETSTNGSKVYNLILSNGNKLEFTAPIGPIGNTGPKGEQGVQGVQGVGISSVRYKNLSEDGSFIYTITLTNNQTYDITCPIGPKGDKGDTGEKGETVAISLEFEDIINNWKIATKYIGNTSTSTDFNSITSNGTYYSNKYNALYTNGFLGANQQAYQEFKLIVIGENNDDAPVLKSQLVITRDDNIYLRSCTSWQAPWTWSEWKKIARMSDVEEKFKNFCPFPVGSVLQMWNETNPTSLYLGTTWELISAGKYVKTGSVALQTGGSNSITLTKDNLPNTKVKVDSFSATISPHYHYIATPEKTNTTLTSSNYLAKESDVNAWAGYLLYSSNNEASIGKTSNNGSGNTGTVSPSTEALGSGKAITIQPEFITLKFWKRTS